MVATAHRAAMQRTVSFWIKDLSCFISCLSFSFLISSTDSALYGSDRSDVSTIVLYDSLMPTPAPGAFIRLWILPRPKNSPPDCFYPGCAGAGLSNPATIKNPATTDVVTGFLVGVAGFEPAASWTRTKRDTKLRHTPIAKSL